MLDKLVTKIHIIKNIAIGSQAAGYVGRLDSIAARNDLMHALIQETH